MRKNSFIFGAVLLAVGGFFARAIGAIYKIPLANILGTNGMGVYYLIFPLYSMLLVMISSGLSIAVSKMVSHERCHNNRRNEIIIFKTAISLVFVVGVFVSLLLVLFNSSISSLQGNTNATLGYLAIAPAVIFASLIAVVRAYFQGLQNMIPTGISNIVEQIVKLVFGLLLANMLIEFGIKYAVFGAILSVTISEFVAFVIIVINYIAYRKKQHLIRTVDEITSEPLTHKIAFKKLIKYSVPATLSSLVMPITGFLDSFMIINILVSSGISSVTSTSLYGISNGMISTLISLPVIFTVAISTIIVPNLSGFHARNNQAEVSFRSTFFIKITWLIALPCFVLMLIFSPEIIEILYSKGLTDKVLNEYDFATKMLMISSISVVYYAFLQTFTSILQSINKPIVPFISLFTALIVRVGLVLLLVSQKNINIFGVTISNVVFLSLATIINLAYLRRFITIKFKFSKMFVSPIVGVLIMGCVLYFIKILMFDKVLPIIYVPLCGVLGILIYIGLIYSMRIFTEKELKMFPNKNKITKKKKTHV